MVKAYKLSDWEKLLAKGDSDAIKLFNIRNSVVERRSKRIPEAYKMEDMQPEHIYWYQKLADYLGKDIHATGSCLRGYWRTKEQEEEIANKYNVKPKYSDLDFFCEGISDKDIYKINKDLKPIAPFGLARWSRHITFKPSKENNL